MFHDSCSLTIAKPCSEALWRTLCKASRSLPASAKSCCRDMRLKLSLYPAHSTETLSGPHHAWDSSRYLGTRGCNPAQLGSSAACVSGISHAQTLMSPSPALETGLGKEASSQHRAGHRAQCHTLLTALGCTSFHFTAFTTKQHLSPVFFKMCLETVSCNLETAPAFLNMKLNKSLSNMKALGASQGATEQQTLYPT